MKNKRFKGTKVPRKLSLVKLSPDMDDKFIKKYKYPFHPKDIFIFLGEIPNMPGHCVVIEHKLGRVFSCYHTDNFVELTDEET